MSGHTVPLEKFLARAVGCKSCGPEGWGYHLGRSTISKMLRSPEYHRAVARCKKRHRQRAGTWVRYKTW